MSGGAVRAPRAAPAAPSVVLVGAGLLLGLGLAAGVRAQPAPVAESPAEPGVDAAALVAEARRAEDDAAPARALVLYRRALAGPLDASRRRLAEARVRWLLARAEGDFGPLSALLSVQRARGGAPRGAEVDRLVRAARGFPPGRVRREALEVAGDLYLRRLGRPRDALAAYEAWAREPGLDAAERALAVSGAALARAALGEPAAGVETLARGGMGARPEMAHLRAQALGVVLRPLAWALLALFLAAALVAGARARARASRARLLASLSPPALGVAAFALLGPVVLAWRYDASLLVRFALGAAGFAVVLLVARLGAAGLDRADDRGRRRVLACAAVAAQLAVGYLVLDATGSLAAWLQAPPLSR